MKPVKKIAVIHDICSVGKAAMTNILPVLSCMGTEVCPVPTMLLSSHTGGYGEPAIEKLGGFVAKAGTHLKEQQVSFSWIFLGYMGSPEAVSGALSFLELFPEVPVLFDPIMGDHGKFYSNFDVSYQDSLLPILQKSHIITPNYTESCFLSGEDYVENPTKEKLARICRKLTNTGCSQVVITGVPIVDFPQTMVLWDESKMEILQQKSEGKFYHGTGDLFAAVLLGELVKGEALSFAVARAHEFVCKCIRYSDRFEYDEREGVILEPFLKELCMKK